MTPAPKRTKPIIVAAPLCDGGGVEIVQTKVWLLGMTDPMLGEPDEPVFAHCVEERPGVGVQNVVHLASGDAQH